MTPARQDERWRFATIVVYYYLENFRSLRKFCKPKPLIALIAPSLS
jgi:hypothetical protein